MKVSVYDKVSGDFLAFGHEKNKNIKKLIKKGHITDTEYGGNPNWRKYDFATTSTTPDEARRQKDVNNKNTKEKRRSDNSEGKEGILTAIKRIKDDRTINAGSDDEVRLILDELFKIFQL